MAPPSKLAVATSSVQRLVKEEASYHKEQEQQEARIQKLRQGNDEDENAEYILKQEQQALQETKKMFPQLRRKITDAVAKLEQELEANKESGGEASTEDVTKAKEVVVEAKKAIREAT